MSAFDDLSDSIASGEMNPWYAAGILSHCFDQDSDTEIHLTAKSLLKEIYEKAGISPDDGYRVGARVHCSYR
jgi:hypothetical protein